jgi:selenocysteine lyase/cysteine desulfurase
MPSDRRTFLRTLAGAPPLAATMWGSPLGLPFTTRSAFPALVADEGRIYLDNAATTHRPQAVLDAIVGYYVADSARPSVSPRHAPPWLHSSTPPIRSK